MTRKANDLVRGGGCFAVVTLTILSGLILYLAVLEWQIHGFTASLEYWSYGAAAAFIWFVVFLAWYPGARARTERQMRETDRRERDDAESLSPFLRGDR